MIRKPSQKLITPLVAQMLKQHNEKEINKIL